jgi:hypothetical protein
MQSGRNISSSPTCKTKCFGGDGVLWYTDYEVHSFGGETAGAAAPMAAMIPASIRHIPVVQVCDNNGVVVVHPTASVRPFEAWLTRTNGGD